MDKRQDQPKLAFDVNAAAYRKALEKARRDLDKVSTHPNTSEDYRENYWPVTSIELSPSDATNAFSAYGSPPYYHIVIRHKDAHSGIYDWHVSPSSGVIITRDIQKDPNVKELPLSEILYHLITKEVLRAEQSLGVQVPSAFKLTRFIQYNVASGETFKVLKAIGMPQDDETQIVCQLGSENALALLGTVNFNSVIYLLKDHGNEVGLSGIHQFTLLKVKNPGKPITGAIVDFEHT